MSTICAIDDAICSADLEAIRRSRITMHDGTPFLRRVLAWLLEREEKRLSRLSLLDLTDEQLADIGISTSEARREAARPFWDWNR